MTIPSNFPCEGSLMGKHAKTGGLLLKKEVDGLRNVDW